MTQTKTCDLIISTYKECFRDCYKKNMFSNTTCVPFWAYSMFKKTNFSEDSDKNCTEAKVRQLIVHGASTSAFCSNKCVSLKSCQYTKYRRIVSKRSRSSATNYNPISKGAIRFLFIFPSVSYTISEAQLIANLSDFLSGIGGNLGLFLGFSLIGTLFGLYNFVRAIIDNGFVGASKQCLQDFA